MSNTNINIKISALSVLVVILVVSLLFLSCQKSKSESALHVAIEELKQHVEHQESIIEIDSIQTAIFISTVDSLSSEYSRTAAALRGLRDSLERAPVEDGLSGQPPASVQDSVVYYKTRYERVSELYALSRREIMQHTAELINLQAKDSVRVGEINDWKRRYYEVVKKVEDVYDLSKQDQSCLDLLIVKIPCPSREVMFVSGVLAGIALHKATS